MFRTFCHFISLLIYKIFTTKLLNVTQNVFLIVLRLSNEGYKYDSF